MKFLNNQITSLTEVKLFVDNLAKEHKLFHFEDDPRDIFDRSGFEIFTVEECDLIDLRIDEICKLGLLEETFNYTLTKYLNN
jgi:hypothetical protein